MKPIRKASLDIDFRRVVAAELASSRKEVIVVTGEGSAFSNYLELQQAVRDASARGVRFRIYSNSYLPGIARKLLGWKCELYTGSRRADDHFMVVDGERAVVSRSHPPGSCGDRHGFVTRRGVPGYSALFRKLVGAGTRVAKVRGPDALEAWLSAPAWTDAPIDTSGMDGDLGQVQEDAVLPRRLLRLDSGPVPGPSRPCQGRRPAQGRDAAAHLGLRDRRGGVLHTGFRPAA